MILCHRSVPVSRKLKKDVSVSYRYEDIEGGGRVRISTKNKEALAAVHEFLKFQISDYRTGDPTKITNERAVAK